MRICRVVEVPEVVRNKARAAGAEQWLVDLPDLLASLCDEWALTIERTYNGGTEAFVAGVVGADGTPAVLKLLVPRSTYAVDNELSALRLANGDGCVRLLRDDTSRHALLLERLGPSMFDLGVPIEQRIPALCTTAMRFWRRVPPTNLPTGAEKAVWLTNYIEAQWAELDQPCSERAVAYALECAERRRTAHDDERSVLVHGDVHRWNALQHGDGFKLIDPDGLIAEAEYDLGIIMREDPVEMRAGDPRERSRQLATWSGLDEQAIWEWGVVERVSTGLMATSIDLQPEGREMLATADAITP